MILGLSIHSFTVLHVVISLIGIVTGLVVLYGMLGAQRMSGWTAVFLAATVLTSVTGFLFPRAGFTPAQGVGIVSLVVLAAALLALYAFRLAGAWRWIYVISATLALYLNVFVGIVQAFQKVPFLQRLAPTQSEPPFIIAQTVVLAIFAVLGYLAVILRPADLRAPLPGVRG
ncbi:MAG: hypothetical protein WA884_17200 [Methyloceanibacter sp.]